MTAYDDLVVLLSRTPTVFTYQTDHKLEVLYALLDLDEMDRLRPLVQSIQDDIRSFG